MSREYDNIPRGELLIYQTEDGRTQIDVFFEDGTIWLNQKQISELYQKGVNTINEHIKHIYEEGELEEVSTIRNFRIVQNEGKREVSRDVDYYNLDMILAVGYRVRSHVGNQFRRWASSVLKEYLKKGFAMNDERLKNPKKFGEDYFDELLERIRDIRSSEKRFYQKIKDIYTLSVDYDPSTEATKEFFATVQNKLHYSVHGRTAAELISERADASKENMGLTNFEGRRIKKSDVTIAKNYLNKEELEDLNRVVTMFLDHAEDMARQQIPMYMKDWAETLNDFLKFRRRDILNNSGKLSNLLAEKKALMEYERYRTLRIKREDGNLLDEYEGFDAIDELDDFEN